jgi:hypothetical protein
MKHLILVLAVVASACGSDSPAAPTPQAAPVVPACQSQNTALLTMANASPNNFTFDVLIDNIGRGTMAPGGSVGPVTLTAAGASHSVVSRVTNTTVVACTSTTSFCGVLVADVNLSVLIGVGSAKRLPISDQGRSSSPPQRPRAPRHPPQLAKIRIDRRNF